MPLYVADYLADTTHLSTIEHGAYMLLIMHYWRVGALPTDDRKLANICRVSGHQWRSIKAALAPFFTPDWKQARVEIELKAYKMNREKAVEKGRAGGNAKALKYKQTAVAGANGGQEKTPPKQAEISSRELGLFRIQNPDSESSSSREARESKPPNGGDDDDEIRKLRVKEALGDKTRPSVAKAVFPAIRQLIEEGCDFERDVLPKLRDIAISGLKTPYPEFLGKQIREGRDARLARERDDANRSPLVFVKIETPQWEAWQAHRGGKSPPVNREGTGWFFPTEWPPGVGPAPAAARPPPASAANPNPAVLH